VWRLRPPSVSLRGAAVRAAADPERDARVFRPRSRDTGPPRGTVPLARAGPEAANSLRPSAGGARVGTAPRARAVALQYGRHGLLKPSRPRRRARIRSLQSRVSALKIHIPRAFCGADMPDVSPTGSPGPSSDGRALVLRPRCTLSTLAAGRNDRLTSSRPTTFDLAGRRASLGLAAHLGHGVEMPRLHFYNQRSRHEHSLSTPLLETALRAPWVTPPASGSDPGESHLSATSARTFARQIEHGAGEALPPSPSVPRRRTTSRSSGLQRQRA
jgi:hypothetical protein